MGVVYLAEDPLLKRRVAVKIVRGGGLEQEEALARFQREAEVSARLSHPNIITVYDVGEEPGIGPFLTMEYVEGASLSELARERKLDPETSVRALLQGKRALEAAHEAGIVHRDIKPANLMLGRDGRVRLMDFGIARADHATMTATGSVIGTPSYLAPEQIDGSDASPATDRYAFAVMAFELFAGRAPFTASNTSAILYKIAHEPPEIPESFDPRLRAVFLRALAKAPADRHASLAEFLIDLIEAAPLEAAARTRLRSQIEEDGPAPSRPAGASPSALAATVPTPLPRLQEGLSLGRAVVWGGALVIGLAAVGAATFYVTREPGPSVVEAPEVAEASPSPAAEEEARPEPEQVAAVEPPAASPQPTATLPAGPDPAELLAEARRRLSGLRPGGILDVIAVAEGTAFLRGEAQPGDVERIEAELRQIAGIESVDASDVHTWPTAAEALPEIRRQLRAEGLGHVSPSVDTSGRLVLAGLASPAEESLARRIATVLLGKNLSLVTSIEKPVVVSPRRERPVRAAVVPPSRPSPVAKSPVWGEIRHEGADRIE